MIPGLISTFAIAVGLAMDAFSVSLAGGAALKKDIAKTALLTGLMFGFFQFAMPVIGWIVGAPVSSIINPFGYWIVVALFFFIGGKMIYDAVKGEEEGVSLIGFKVLTLLAIATSIDALAVGFSLSFFSLNIIVSILIIGIVTFIISTIGLKIGKIIGNKFKSIAEFLGGIILLAIGIKILIEHTYFS